MIPAFQKHGKELNRTEANKLMNAIIKIQASNPANEVSCTDFDGMPELKSLFFGAEWAKWVNARCFGHASIPWKGTNPTVWAPGGIQYLEAVVAARGPAGARIKSEFINEKVIPCLRKYGIANPTVDIAEQYIQKAIDFQNYGALTSIKRKNPSLLQERGGNAF